MFIEIFINILFFKIYVLWNINKCINNMKVMSIFYCLLLFILTRMDRQGLERRRRNVLPLQVRPTLSDQ